MAKTNYISESFKQRADSSAFFEAWVGAMLSRSNLYTLHHPFTLAAETGNPLSFYAHTWDLDVGAVNGGYMYPVEVKSVNLKFTEPNDYPHLGVLVCSEASFQKKWPGLEVTQRDFLMVSRASGGIIWLPKYSPTTVIKQKDRTRGERYACRATRKEYLKSLSDFVNRITNHSSWEADNV
jgi:hypothetical protein